MTQANTLVPHMLHYFSTIDKDKDLDDTYMYHGRLEDVPQASFAPLVDRAVQYSVVMQKIKAAQDAAGMDHGWLHYGPTSDTEERIWPRVFDSILDGEDTSGWMDNVSGHRAALEHFMGLKVVTSPDWFVGYTEADRLARRKAKVS